MAANKLMGAKPKKKVNPPPPKGKGSGPMPIRSSGRAGKAMDEERQYRAQDALSTLVRAKEHMGDKQLMGDVRRLAAERAAHYANLAKK